MLQIVATGLISIGLALNVRDTKFAWLSVIEVLPTFLFSGVLIFCWYTNANDAELLIGGRSLSFLAAAFVYAYFVLLPYVTLAKFSWRRLATVYLREREFMVGLGNFCNRGAYYFPTIMT